MTQRPKQSWRRRTIRWGTRPAACLLLGAVTTVAVAWGLVQPWGAAGPGEVEVRLKTSEQWWVIWCERRRFDARVRVFSVRCWHRRFGVRSGEADSHRDESTPAVGILFGSEPRSAELDEAMMDTVRGTPFYGGVYEDMSGTPIMIALRASWARFPVPSDDADILTSVAAGYPVLAMRGSWNRAETIRGGVVNVGDRRLPLHPILPGFLLDTLFYAAPWWLILVTPGALRRRRRHRRGRCIHCGYDLAGLEADAICPECGA